MPSINKYLSVIAPPVDTGTVTITFRSVNRSPVVTFDAEYDVTDTTLTERQYAEGIFDVLNTAFTTNDAVYTGQPSFAQEGVGPFSFRALQCDHIVNVWSQSEFSMLVNPDNSTGLRAVSESIPIYSTIADAKKLAPIMRIRLCDVDGQPYDEDTVQELLLMCSQEIISYMNGDVRILSTYMSQERGFDTNGINLDFYPVIYNDPPVVRGPLVNPYYGYSSLPVNGSYDIDSEYGIVSFDTGGNLPYGTRPLDADNLYAMTYAAGLTAVHPILKRETVRAISLLTQPLNISRMKGGTFSIDLIAPDVVRKTIQGNLSRAIGL